MKIFTAVLVAGVIYSSVAQSGQIQGINKFKSGDVAVADDVNKNFSEVETQVNDNARHITGNTGLIQATQKDLSDLSKSVDALLGMVSLAVPAGTVLAFAGSVEKIPVGWLLCDGALVSRTEYKILFDVIGITHGGGDGVLTFNVPDYRGRFLRGVDHGTGRDPNAGSRTPPQPDNLNSGLGNTGDAVGSIQEAATAMPNNNFSISPAGVHSHGIQTRQDDYNFTNGYIGPSYGYDNGTFSVTNNTDSAGSHTHSLLGGDAETRPKNAYVNWIIKY